MYLPNLWPSYFKSAKELGDILVVALNSDEWLIKKKGKSLLIERLSSLPASFPGIL